MDARHFKAEKINESIPSALSFAGDDRNEQVPRYVFPCFSPGFQPVLVGGGEVDTAVNAAQARFTRRIGETSKSSHYSGKTVRRGDELKFIAARQLPQHGSGRAAERAVPRSILRERRCDQERRPVWIRFGGRITVVCSGPNRGDRPPPVISEFCVPTD